MTTAQSTEKDSDKPFVLLVEDDPSVSTVLARYLDASGYRSLAVGSAAEAVDLVDAKKPDVVVTDIFLADGDGFDLIKALRVKDTGIPIIAISGGRAGFDVLAHAAKLGASATIEKPFSPAYLVDTIDRCLEEFSTE